MKMKDENIYYYSIMLHSGFIEFIEYEKWLNHVFLEDAENQYELLCELQYATNSLDKTLSILDEYFHNRTSTLDFDLLGKMIVKRIEVVYKSWILSVEELSHRLYGLWSNLPYSIQDQQPFFTMNCINDPISYGARAQAIDLIEWLIDFYD